MCLLWSLVTGCSEDDTPDAGTTASALVDEEATPPPTSAPTAAPTQAPPAETVPFEVTAVEVVFTDDTRETPPSGDQPGLPERVLETRVLHPAATDSGPFPLIVFSHGLGAPLDLYEPILQRWASAGFVVVAPRFPLSRPENPAGPDASDVQNQTGDVAFLVDAASAEFPEFIDVDHVGAAGHSNGAITTIGATLHTCCIEDRIDAAIEFAGTANPFADGEYDFTAAPPYLIVHGTDDALINYANAVSLYNNLTGPKGVLTREGGDHSGMFAAGSEWFEQTADVTTDFWTAHLAGDTAALGRLAGGDPDLRWYDGESEPVDVIPTVEPLGEREANAEPTTNLVDGAVVTVTWEGFTPGGTVNVVQCSEGGTGGAGFCDLTVGKILQPNPTGAGTVDLEIVVGPVGEGACGPATTDCVVVINDSGLTEPEATIRIPISFAP